VALAEEAMRHIRRMDLRGMSVLIYWTRSKPAWAPRDCENGCLDHTRMPWRIWVSTVGSKANQRDTLMHEINHAINESSGVDTLNLEKGYEAEEDLVHRQTGGLLDWLERNPELVAELSKKRG